MGAEYRHLDDEIIGPIADAQIALDNKTNAGVEGKAIDEEISKRNEAFSAGLHATHEGVGLDDLGDQPATYMQGFLSRIEQLLDAIQVRVRQTRIDFKVGSLLETLVIWEENNHAGSIEKTSFEFAIKQLLAITEEDDLATNWQRFVDAFKAAKVFKSFMYEKRFIDVLAADENQASKILDNNFEVLITQLSSAGTTAYDGGTGEGQNKSAAQIYKERVDYLRSLKKVLKEGSSFMGHFEMSDYDTRRII